MASVALGVAGAALGSRTSKGFSWWSFGIQLGIMALDHALVPGSRGPRLADLTIQLADQGAIIPRVYGVTRETGNLIWTTGKTESHHQESGGSLGPPQTTVYTYTANVAVLISDNPTVRPLKIWANQHLIYDSGYEPPSIEQLVALSPDAGSPFSTTVNTVTPDSLTLTQDGTTGAWSGTLGGFSLRFYTGTQTQPADALIVADKGVGNVPAWLGKTYMVLENFDLTPFDNSLPTFSVLTENGISTLAALLADVATQAGLNPSTDLDMTALGSDSFIGYLVTDQIPARNVFDDVGQFFFVDFPMQNGKLTAIKRSRSTPDFIIPDDELRRRLTGQGDPLVQIALVQELEKPEEIDYHFINPDRNYVEDIRRWINQNTSSTSQASLTARIVAAGNSAQRVVNIEGARQWVESEGYQTQLDWRYLHMTATDILQVNTPAGVRLYRVVQIQKNSLGPITINAVRHVPTVYDAALPLDTAGLTPPTLQSVGGVSVWMADMNAMRDSDNAYPGFYFAVSAPDSMTWPTVTVLSPPLDNHAAFMTYGNSQTHPEALAKATMGTLHGTFAANPAGDNVIDTTNTLTVDLLANDFSSITHDQLIAGGNMLQVGLETVQFMDAAYVGEFSGRHRYNCTNLLRGRRGTEQFCGTHSSGEPCVLLNSAVIHWYVTNYSVRLPATLQVTESSVAASISHNFTINLVGRNLMPYAPFNVHLNQDMSDAWNFSWDARSRYVEDTWNYWTTGIDAVSGEAVDSWLVEILNGSNVVVASYLTNTQTFAYDSAAQTADFGSVQSTLAAQVSKINVIVGAGYRAVVEGPTGE